MRHKRIDTGGLTVRRNNKRVCIVVLGVFVMVFLFSFLAFKYWMDKKAGAVSMANFDPGYIISDWQMGNYNSMSEADIQAFLKSKNSCYDTNVGKYTSGEKVGYFSEMSPPRTWHVKDGHFVCMADEVFNGGTAAHIIYRAAQDYRINPQVLIVLLEKEQSLITDTFPHSQQYRSATGYGCPDTAPCSSQYYGLQNQIRKAAELFRTVLDGGWTNYPLGNNYVQYNPSSSCGGSVINIRSLATSALYRYTPYQPNSATLSGWNDGCGAYGNMNFYRLFEDWFGGITETHRGLSIPEGSYYIQATNNSNMVLDVDAGLRNDGANVQLYEKNKTDAQKWTVKYNAVTDDYTFINVNSGKALDVEGASEADGANIHIWELNGTCAQRWKLVADSGNGVKMLSTCSQKSLSINNNEVKNEGNIVISTPNSNSSQRWVLMPVDEIEEGLYTITSAITEKKSLDISGGSHNAVDGTNLQLWDSNNTAAQRWYIAMDKEGYYMIRNLASSKVIDVNAAETRNSANIHVWQVNKTCAQKWQAVKTSSGYTFISACGHGVLDVSAANTKNGTNIQLYESNGTKAQQWSLKKVSIVEDGKYAIVSKLPNSKVLDVAGNYKGDGANIQLYDANGTTAQKWTIKYDSKTDFYTIYNEGVERALDVLAAGRKNKTNVQTWGLNSTCAQKWTIVKNSDDDVTVFSACSGLALDVDAGMDKNGANIQLYEPNGTKAQRWSLIKEQ